MSIWLTIIGMAVVTYATRIALLLGLRGEIAPWLRRWLGFVPVALFTALVAPPLLIAGSPPQFTIGPALPAGIVGALVAWRSRNLLLTIGAGMATFWLLRLVGG